MTTTLTRRIDSAEKRITNLQHIEKIATAMFPDCREWVYDGEVTEDSTGQSKCTCGHNIKTIFWIVRKRDGNKLPIGCVCIDNTVPYLLSNGAEGLAASLVSAKEEYETAKKAIEKAKKQAELDLQCQSAKELYERYYNRAKSIIIQHRNCGQRIPYNLYWFSFSSPKEYANTKGYITWYNKQADSLKIVLERDGYYE